MLTGIEVGVIELTTSTECVREMVLMNTDPPPRDTETEHVPEFPPLINPFSFTEHEPISPTERYCNSSSDSPPNAEATVSDPAVSGEDVIDTAIEVCGFRNPKKVRCLVRIETVPSGRVKYPSAALSGRLSPTSWGILRHVISSSDDPMIAPLGILGIRISIGESSAVTSNP